MHALARSPDRARPRAVLSWAEVSAELVVRIPPGKELPVGQAVPPLVNVRIPRILIRMQERAEGAAISAAVVSFCRPTMSNLVAWMEKSRQFSPLRIAQPPPLSVQQPGAIETVSWAIHS
jgi:hypothetical protein